MAMTLLTATILSGILLSLPVCLLLLGRRNNHAWKQWTYLLDAHGAREHRRMASVFKDEGEMIDSAYARALVARYRATTEEAIRLLDGSYRFLSAVCNDRLELLRQMTDLARMVTSMVPWRPVAVTAFRLSRLSGWAALFYAAHFLLVTARERFMLRLYILRLGFKIALAAVFRGTNRVKARPDLDAAWILINTGRLDFHTLSAETLESYRVLLLSWAAEREVASV